MAKSFNFPLHKQSQSNSNSINYQFFQSESMSFLAEQGFDFSNTFQNGLSYDRLTNKEKLQDQINKKPLYKFGFYLCEKSENAKTKVFKQIEEFMQTPNKNKFEVDCESSFLARHLVKYFNIKKINYFE